MKSIHRPKKPVPIQRILLFALAAISTAILLSSCTSTSPTMQEDTQESKATEGLENTGTLIFESEDHSVSDIPAVQGANSVKSLLEKSLDYLHSECDYTKIADVHDQQACIAYALITSLYQTSFATERCTEITWDQAMEKAALFFGDAQTLQKNDPELARMMMDNCVVDLKEHLDEIISEIRESFREGYITEGDSDYETLYSILTDWDKGSDYILEQYQEDLQSILFGGQKPKGVFLSLDEAMEFYRSYARGENWNGDLMRLKNLAAEYHPENAEAGRNGGIFIYDIGSLELEHDVWSVSMLYYVREAVYYLIDYTVTVI